VPLEEQIAKICEIIDGDISVNVTLCFSAGPGLARG
jgi:hypothetical protein